MTYSAYDTLESTPSAFRSREMAASHIEGLKAFLAEQTRKAIAQYVAEHGVQLVDPWPVNYTARGQSVLLNEFIQIHLDWLDDCSHDNAANYLEGVG